MQEGSTTNETLPGGKFAMVLGGLCVLLFSGTVAAAWWDNSHHAWLETAVMIPMPDEESQTFFPMPAELKAGAEIARMDNRPLYLSSVGAVSHDDEEVLATGIEDQRIYPIYQLRVPPEQGPNYLLLKISPGTYLKVRDRLDSE